jgi:hypothetical protein
MQHLYKPVTLPTYVRLLKLNCVKSQERPSSIRLPAFQISYYLAKLHAQKMSHLVSPNSCYAIFWLYNTLQIILAEKVIKIKYFWAYLIRKNYEFDNPVLKSVKKWVSAE